MEKKPLYFGPVEMKYSLVQNLWQTLKKVVYDIRNLGCSYFSNRCGLIDYGVILPKLEVYT